MNYIGSKYSLMDFLTETISTVAANDNKKVTSSCEVTFFMI